MSSPAGFLIVGGGLAGAALALLLRNRGAERVTLVEAVGLPDLDSRSRPALTRAAPPWPQAP